MTKTTTTITRTTYGVWVQAGRLDADCTLGKRMDGTIGLCVDGRLTITDDTTQAAVIAMFDSAPGTTLTITNGDDIDNSADLAAYDAHYASVCKMMAE